MVLKKLIAGAVAGAAFKGHLSHQQWKNKDRSDYGFPTTYTATTRQNEVQDALDWQRVKDRNVKNEAIEGGVAGLALTGLGVGAEALRRRRERRQDQQDADDAAYERRRQADLRRAHEASGWTTMTPYDPVDDAMRDWARRPRSALGV